LVGQEGVWEKVVVGKREREGEALGAQEMQKQETDHPNGKEK